VAHEPFVAEPGISRLFGERLTKANGLRTADLEPPGNHARSACRWAPEAWLETWFSDGVSGISWLRCKRFSHAPQPAERATDNSPGQTPWQSHKCSPGYRVRLIRRPSEKVASKAATCRGWVDPRRVSSRRATQIIQGDGPRILCVWDFVLPFLGQRALYARYRFNEPWNGPNNSKLANVRVPQYECPEQNGVGAPFMTSYVAVVGKQAAWRGRESMRLQDFRDRSAGTIMVVEMADSGIHWMEPRDLPFATLAMSVNPKSGMGISSLHCDPGWRHSRLGANIGMVNGEVEFLPTGTPQTEVRAMMTAAGGEENGTVSALTGALQERAASFSND
jgi:hypothetical protein